MSSRLWFSGVEGRVEGRVENYRQAPFFPEARISDLGWGGGAGGAGGGNSLPLADLIYFPVSSVRLGRDQYKRTIEAVK